MDLTRERVKLWLEAVLAQTGDTPTGIARRASIAQSTVTRFLNDPDGPMLTLRTISKIAHATGIAPEGFSAPLPDLQPSGPAEAEATPFAAGGPGESGELAAAVRALTVGRNAADAWRLRTHALAYAGYLPGDIVIVDLGLIPSSGDVVCAQHYAWSSGTAETIFRLYEPPYLVTASSDPALRRPLVVDSERVVIKGVVTAMLRIPG
jgi:transcriptional regulator with XRE-family HTH domain